MAALSLAGPMGFEPGDRPVVGTPDGAHAVVAMDDQFGFGYARNRRYVSLGRTGSNLADTGWERCAIVHRWTGNSFWLVFNGWQGDHGEVLRGGRGDAAGTESTARATAWDRLRRRLTRRA